MCSVVSIYNSVCDCFKNIIMFTKWKVNFFFIFSAGVKLLVLCDLFMQRKGELTREQRHEIIRYAKSRLPIFMSQLHRFLVGLKSTLSSMSPAQRQEIATYLVPEVSANDV